MLVTWWVSVCVTLEWEVWLLPAPTPTVRPVGPDAV